MKTKDKARADISRMHFFEKTVYHEKVRECLSGDNEERVMKLFEILGYKVGKDYERQYPIAKRYVLDFAFVKEQFAIEVDGENHNLRRQTRKDKIRDRYLRENNWVTLRIKDKQLFGDKLSFFKSLIKLLVKERREQYYQGRLYPMDFSSFNSEEDYE